MRARVGCGPAFVHFYFFFEVKGVLEGFGGGGFVGAWIRGGASLWGEGGEESVLNLDAEGELFLRSDGGGGGCGRGGIGASAKSTDGRLATARSASGGVAGTTPAHTGAAGGGDAAHLLVATLRRRDGCGGSEDAPRGRHGARKTGAREAGMWFVGVGSGCSACSPSRLEGKKGCAPARQTRRQWR